MCYAWYNRLNVHYVICIREDAWNSQFQNCCSFDPSHPKHWGDDWGSPISRNNHMKYEIIIWWIPGGLPGRFGSDRRFPYSIINPICSIEYLPTFGPLLGYILLNISAPWSIWVIFQQQYGSPGNAECVCVCMFLSISCGYNDAMGYSMGGRTKNMICALIQRWGFTSNLSIYGYGH